MYIQTPSKTISKAKTLHPNLRRVDPSARGGSADSYFTARNADNGRGGNRQSGHVTDKVRGGASTRTVKPNRRIRKEQKTGESRKGPRASRLILWSLVIGILGYGYITHVFSTQELNNEVNELRRTFEIVQANNAAQALTYDRMTGPAEVYRRARALGFIDPGPADHVIVID